MITRCRAVGAVDERYSDVSSDEMSQTFSEEPRLPLTIRFPSGLKLTLETSSVCPLSVSVSWPLTDLFAAAFCSASSKVRRMRGQRRRGEEVSNDFTEQERTDMM